MVSAQQFIDLARIEYRISPNNEVRTLGQTSLNIENADANILVPIKVDSSNYILAGFSHSSLALSGLLYQSNVVQMGWQHTWSQDWKSTLLFMPKSSTSQRRLEKNDFQLGGVFIATKSKSPTFQWKFGAYINGDRFGMLTVPIFGFKWQVNPTTQIDASLPLGATIRKTVGKKFHVGVVYSGRKFSFNNGDSYLEVGDNNVWCFADVYLTKSIVLHVRAGHSVLRDYVFFKNGERVDVSFGSFELGDNRPQNSASISQGYSFQTGLIWRINLEK